MDGPPPRVSIETKEKTQRPAEPEVAPVAYNDPLGRSTPQGTVLGFMKAAAQGEYDQALRYLDTRTTGPAAQKIIAGLQAILESGFSGNLAVLSNKPEGALDDDLPASAERVGTVKTASGSLDILLERVQRGKEPPIWLFSAATLTRVLQVQRELDIRTLDDYVPKFLVSTWFLWFPLWQWIVFLLLIPLSYGLAAVATRLFTPLVLLSLRRMTKVRADQHVVRLSGPIRILMFALAIWVISLYSRSFLGSLFWTYLASTLTVIGATWLCVRVMDIVFKLKQRQFSVTSSSKVSLMQLVEKVCKVLAVIAGALVILHIAGINIAAAITGLGIGGIAIAFAAQKTLENLFGGVMIISDRPIRVGDFCRAGDTLGTVENIGLRSTRIRTLKRTVVSVPNGQLAVMNLENFAVRDKIWFHHHLSLRYETTADQLRYILAEIRKMLYEHPKVESMSARVRFVGFGNSSLNLEVFAYVLETEYEPFLSSAGRPSPAHHGHCRGEWQRFCFPVTDNLPWRRCEASTPGRAGKPSAAVRQWREQGRLPFPDFSPETIAEIENKTEYPPPESALRKKRKE